MRVMTTVTMVALLGAAVVSANATATAEGVSGNLLRNHDFTAGELGSPPPGWQPQGYTGLGYELSGVDFETCAEGREGSRALRIVQPPGHQWVYAQQFVPLTLEQDSRYSFSAGVRSAAAGGADADLVMMVSAPEPHHNLRILQRRERVRVGPDWEEFSTALELPAIRQADGTPVELQLRVILQFYGTGEYYVDSARLERTEAEGLEALGTILQNDPVGLTSPLGLQGGIVTALDGTLLAFKEDYSVASSSDGGRTWSAARSLEVPDALGKVQGVFRTQAGRILIWTQSWKAPMYGWYSDDDGATWSERISIGPHGMPLEGMRMIETSTGRLAIPVLDSWGFWGEGEAAYASGILDGERIRVEGHAHILEIERTKVYYSDDQGQSWQQNAGDIAIWKDDGYGGIWPADEPNLVELSDGRLMLYFRTTLGRVYASYSADGGHRWTYPEATELPNSCSPVCLKRIPQTGDLLLVWNNVSAEEIRRGFRRGRLCSALSRDDGQTWENVKTLDTAGLPPVSEVVKPDPPGMVRADKDLGELPPIFGYVAYADVFFLEDRVLVKYLKSFVNPPGLSSMKLLDLPLEWFYED